MNVCEFSCGRWRMKFNTRTLLTYLLITVLLLADITMFWGSTWYYDAGYKMSTPHATQANTMYFLAGIILMLFVLHKFPSFRYFKRSSRITVFLMCCCSLIWAFVAIRSGESVVTVFIRQYAPLMFLLSGAMLVGDDCDTVNIFRKFANRFAVVYFLISIFYELQLLISQGIGNRPKSCAIYVFLVEGIVMWLFSAFDDDNSKYSFWTKIGIVLLAISCFLTLGRGYISIAIICCYLYFVFDPCRRSMSITSHIKFIMVMIATLIAVNLVAPNMVEVFIGRLTLDSRSGQYDQFFSQVTVLDLLLGKGMNATYSFSRFENYSYIDNCNLVMMFRYGAIPVLSEFFLFISTLVKSYKQKSSENWQLVLIWILMTSGLSVYLPYQLNFACIIVWIAVGNSLSLRSNMV